MKRFFLTIVAASLFLGLAAQETPNSICLTDGYRGFAGLNVFAGIGEYPYDRFAITSVHGFQADNMFIGLGASMQFKNNEEVYYDDEDEVALDFVMPFFVNFNYEFPMVKLSPFVDLKLGYSVGDANGMYLLPSIGIRLSHINVWCGYNYLQSTSVYDKSYYDKDGDYHRENKTLNHNFNSIAFGVLIDWGARKK